jgi:hypothetical protein
MKSTITVPHHSHRNAAKDAQAVPAPSYLPSRCYSPSKKDKHGGEAAIAPSVPSITLAAVNAASAAAVAAANLHRRIACLLAPTADVSEPVSSTLHAGIALFPVANIMPTVALGPTAKFARPEAVAADVSIATAAAYSTLGVTIVATAEAAAADVTVATVASANLATAEAVAAGVPVPVATAASSSPSLAAIDFAAAAVVAPVVALLGNEGVSFK